MRWHKRPSVQPEPATALEPDHSAGSDLELVLAQTAEWIRNADAKTGLLLTALTVLLAAVSAQAHLLRRLWRGHGQVSWALVVFAASVVLLAVAFALLVAVLVPRTKASKTRYAWPWIASASLAELEALSPGSARAEAWAQAKTLSEIARHKYRFFRLAVWASAGSVLAFLIWSISRP